MSYNLQMLVSFQVIGPILDLRLENSLRCVARYQYVIASPNLESFASFVGSMCLSEVLQSGEMMNDTWVMEYYIMHGQRQFFDLL